MPIAARSSPAWRRPARMSVHKPRTSQYSRSPTGTGPLRNRRISVRSSRSGDTVARITRPLDAPRSTAAKFFSFTGSAQERGGDAGVDRDVQTGGLRQVTGGQRVDRVGDVVGQDLLAEQG